MKNVVAGFGGCLLWLVFLVLVGAGFVITLSNGTSPIRFAGPVLVLATGGGIIYAGRWRWFDAGLRFLALMSGNVSTDTKYEEDYRSQTGVHSGPMITGALVVLLGLALVLVAFDLL